MKYIIEEFDGLFCIYRQEKSGQRIVEACETKREALEAVQRLKKKGA